MTTRNLRAMAPASSRDDADAVRVTVETYLNALACQDYKTACGCLCRGGQAILLASVAASGFTTDNCALATSHLMQQQARNTRHDGVPDLACRVAAIDGDHATVVL
jgi:hypothetical protein